MIFAFTCALAGGLVFTLIGTYLGALVNEYSRHLIQHARVDSRALVLIHGEGKGDAKMRFSEKLLLQTGATKIWKFEKEEDRTNWLEGFRKEILDWEFQDN